MDWRDRGACLGEDPELFFPVGDLGPARAQLAAAKQVCQRCPVRGQCRDWALSAGADGVWGGMDDAERRRLRRTQRQNAA
jgi:WhiB family redox-sensing transcriptional regulator